MCTISHIIISFRSIDDNALGSWSHPNFSRGDMSLLKLMKRTAIKGTKRYGRVVLVRSLEETAAQEHPVIPSLPTPPVISSTGMGGLIGPEFGSTGGYLHNVVNLPMLQCTKPSKYDQYFPPQSLDYLVAPHPSIERDIMWNVHRKRPSAVSLETDQDTTMFSQTSLGTQASYENIFSPPVGSVLVNLPTATSLISGAVSNMAMMSNSPQDPPPLESAHVTTTSAPNSLSTSQTNEAVLQIENNLGIGHDHFVAQQESDLSDDESEQEIDGLKSEVQDPPAEEEDRDVSSIDLDAFMLKFFPPETVEC